MLTVGDRLPAFSLTSVVSTNPKTAFTDLTEASNPGKWKVVFFWPKDFTFVCPTEIATFGKLNGEFNDRDAVRATFIVDPEGVIRFVSVNDMSVGRNPQEVLRVLDALQTDELCPCNWQKGDDVLKAA